MDKDKGADEADSKLRVHLEDARTERNRSLEACQTHMAELEDRRNQMNKLSSESKHERQSLQAATAQLAELKAQLDKAVEQKVQRRLLKVSPKG